MKEVHDFDFEQIKNHLKLTFYEQMKLINWIRKEKSEKAEIDVMDVRERILAREWNSPQFYFPTFQDDHVSWIISVFFDL